MTSKTLYMVSGRLGVTGGMDTSASDNVQEDADGNPSSTRYVIDISRLMSENLGRQMPQMATYRIKTVSLSLRNKDDTNDNNYGLAVGGRFRWYSPTSHRINALQYAREYKREHLSLPSDADDPFAPWANDRKYKGLRFNWQEDSDGVAGATPDDTSLLAGTEFSMYEIFDHYNQVIGGLPAESGYDSADGIGDALWDTRIGLDKTDNLFWNAYYRNSAYQDGTGFENAFIFQPEVGPWEYTTPADTHLSAMGGLVVVTVEHTNTENPRAGDVNDNYYVQCSIGIEGWSEF